MSVKPNDETTEALLRISQQGEWKHVEKWLLERREGWVQLSLSADEAKSRQAQGRFAEIDELLRITRAAESSVRR